MHGLESLVGKLLSIYVLDMKMTTVKQVVLLRTVILVKQMLLPLVGAHLEMLLCRMRYRLVSKGGEL